MKRKKRYGYLLLALVVTLACVPTFPSVASLPTQPVGAVDTIVAGTYAAASTGTAVNTTATPTSLEAFTPSRTPTITPTGTATIIFKIPTVAISSGGGGGGSSGGGTVSYGPPPEFACRVVKVTPLLGAHIAANKDFKTIWQVINRGASAWDANSVDYQYALGVHLHTQPLYDLPFSVPPGNTVNLVVAMHSPARPGTYASTWVMRVSNQAFCRLEMMIIVR